MDILKKLLYYPYISIPNAAWLKQALLYWDGIATIVPTDCLNNTKYFTRFARNVVRQGIIETVSPDNYAYSYPNEYLKFLDWAIENASHFPIEENRFNNSVTKQYNIHTGKISFIGSELERCGLAHRIDNQWYAMNSKLSMSFMTFLAILIGQSTDYIPTTDTYKGMSALFNVDMQSAYKNSRDMRNTMRNSILDEILPVPKDVEDLNDILRFKDKYNDELVRFRRHIENFIAELEGLPQDLQIERCNYFIENAKDEIDDIKGHMRWFKTPEIEMGTVISALASAIDFASNNYVGGTLNVANVISDAFLNTDRSANRRKPLAYAALYKSRYRPK